MLVSIFISPVARRASQPSIHLFSRCAAWPLKSKGAPLLVGLRAAAALVKGIQELTNITVMLMHMHARIHSSDLDLLCVGIEHLQRVRAGATTTTMEHRAAAPDDVIVQVNAAAVAAVDERISTGQITEEEVIGIDGGKQQIGGGGGGLTRRTFSQSYKMRHRNPVV